MNPTAGRLLELRRSELPSKRTSAIALTSVSEITLHFRRINLTPPRNVYNS
ncbi:MAG: hypothetical protein ACTS44_01515 [Candidatus Hodgkinia cicadicola]